MNPKQTPRRSVNFKTLTSLNSASAHGIHDVVQAPFLPSQARSAVAAGAHVGLQTARPTTAVHAR